MALVLDPFRNLDQIAQQVFGAGRSAMPMDIYRKGDEFVAAFDLPGVDPASIEATVEQGVLTVKATRSLQPGDGVEVIAQERTQGRFIRQLALGEFADTENIRASYDRGVLILTIPVAERARPRRVVIHAEDSSAEVAGIAASRSGATAL